MEVSLQSEGKLYSSSTDGRPRTIFQKLSSLSMPAVLLYYKLYDSKSKKERRIQNQVTEKELEHINKRIDKLLARIDEKDSKTTRAEDEECVVCLESTATMRTFPCNHEVVCRKCFIKTVQVAVADRCLPLRCVICRSRILNVKQQHEKKTKMKKIQRLITFGFIR